MENQTHPKLGESQLTTATIEEVRQRNLTWPYTSRSRGAYLNEEQIKALEQAKSALNGLTFQEADDVVSVLKDQLQYMCVVSLP